MEGPLRGLRGVPTLIQAQPEGESSKSKIWDYAVASPSLWTRLDKLVSRRRLTCGVPGSSLDGVKDDAGAGAARRGVAVVFPVDRRLGGKGSGKGLIIWVIKDEKARQGSESVLSLPSHLIPPFSPSHLIAMIYPHDPLELSMVILQPVMAPEEMSDSAILNTEDLDVSTFLKGYVGDDPDPPSRIIRQGEYVSLPRRSDTSLTSHSDTAHQIRAKVIMTDPVDQGTITPSTRVVISTEPLVETAGDQMVDGGNDDVDDISESSQSQSRSHSHLSMVDFDPDAFLSSSLEMRLSHRNLDQVDDERPNGYGYDDEDLTGSIDSSTSGTITPRRALLNLNRAPSPSAKAEDILNDGETDGLDYHARFSAVCALGPSSSTAHGDDSDVCWMGLSGLGGSGIFENDWVLIRPVNPSDPIAGNGRLVRAVAWEYLDQEPDELPADPLLLSPRLHRALFPTSAGQAAGDQLVVVMPTSFGARRPTLPLARTITLARVATTEGVDKRYERSWIRGLKSAFRAMGPTTPHTREDDFHEHRLRMVRRGDVISVPVWKDRPMGTDEGTLDDLDESSGSDEDEDGDIGNGTRTPTEASSVAYFIVTGLSYEPLVPLEEDFAASASSKARAGELGCWVDVGDDGVTKMILNGVERSRICNRANDRSWHGQGRSLAVVDRALRTKMRDLLLSGLASAARSIPMPLSALIKGARGSGKNTFVQTMGDELGYNLVKVNSYDLLGETTAHIEGTLQAALVKASSCSPSILLINHIEALARKTEASTMGRTPPIVRTLQDLKVKMVKVGIETGFPCILMASTIDVEDLSPELLGCFKQDLTVRAPDASQRETILRNLFEDGTFSLSADVSIPQLASQSAALLPEDMQALVLRARDLSLNRVQAEGKSTCKESSSSGFTLAGISITASDLKKALEEARTSYADSIGAPKIPNVQWEDIGGLASVKKDILETVQLPLDHPELFADGLKKRSGVLLYGPPGTGKTLLAKAVATSCNLNFFSVKGPELLNMYIGESEANVRRVFQKARDASPCIIFMDELDSVAPKRGNQGDSGGVMDRIVSQLLAELDGMSSDEDGESSSNVFVMGATNRPDLLDPALLRPGRFDKMLYLSIPTTDQAQFSILQALTRKFTLDPSLDLEEIAGACPFNYTGADFYALCSDAILRAMTRKAEEVDAKVLEINAARQQKRDEKDPHQMQNHSLDGAGPGSGPGAWEGGTVGKQMRAEEGTVTTQYYLSNLASKADAEVEVNRDDFLYALERLVPSVSADEMRHYDRVQRDFKSYSITPNGDA